MPEYPEVVIYVERLRDFVQGQRLEQVRIGHPFVLRTAEPPITTIEGMVLQGVARLGKRIIFEFEDAIYLVLHLMIAGRLTWHPRGKALPKRRGLAALDFENGTLFLTESSTQKRASLHLVRGAEALDAFDRGGLEVMEASLEAFAAAG
ncbi:MAG: DNA-formamidopyrimidine glycosylase family protein, partial [Anaerolineae bacterium]